MRDKKMSTREVKKAVVEFASVAMWGPNMPKDKQDALLGVLRWINEHAEAVRLQEALDYAIMTIVNYEMDIRNSQDTVVGLEDIQPLSELGFCQGILYKNALHRIEEICN